MPRWRLVWRIFPSHLFVTLAALAAFTAYTAHVAGQFHLTRVSRELEARGRLMSDAARETLARGVAGEIDALCRELGEKASSRVTVVLPSGEVVGDSEESPQSMDNHANRPEIVTAMSGDVGRAIRFSRTLQRDLMYVALPVYDGTTLVAVLRVALPLTTVQSALWSNRTDVFLGATVIALLAAIASWLVARQIARPLEELKQGAELFARGDFKYHLRIPASEEIASLAQAMNQMADQLDQRIRTIVNQRNQQEAVLSSMIEGVIAVDVKRAIISLNHGAARMLGVASQDVQGQSIETAVRNTALQEFVTRALDSHAPIEDEFVLHTQQEQVVQVHGTVLRDAHGNGLGAVIVLNDVTALRRLEQVRRDFVANVSHELRTPITSIKGFVETLLGGALEKPDDARRFLEIVARQADRLNAILEDLLILSRTEAGEWQKEIRLERLPIREVIDAAITLCRPKASVRGIEMTVTCPEDLEARVNAPLLEQAVANLVDNAVKYSEPEKSVHVEASQVEGEVVIRVEDHGAGIPSEHLPRLFERFYRVDKARSRGLGGTGLGLAIVKHIAQAHGGRVGVESVPGKGSTFSVYLQS